MVTKDLLSGTVRIIQDMYKLAQTLHINKNNNNKLKLIQLDPFNLFFKLDEHHVVFYF